MKKKHMKTHVIIHQLTILFAWICWVVGLWYMKYWLFIISFVPYLIWNQYRIPGSWPEKRDNDFVDDKHNEK